MVPLLSIASSADQTKERAYTVRRDYVHIFDKQQIIIASSTSMIIFLIASLTATNKASTKYEQRLSTIVVENSKATRAAALLADLGLNESLENYNS